MSWARRLKRVFGIEIEGCARCGGKLKIIASIEEPEVIAKILSHLERTAPQVPQSSCRSGCERHPCSPGCFELAGEGRLRWPVTRLASADMSRIQVRGRSGRFAGARHGVSGLSEAGRLSGEALWRPELPGKSRGA